MIKIETEVIQVYVETGRKRTFAGAIEWPGWCRIGDDESSALLAMYNIGQRYAEVLQASLIEFKPPAELKSLVVVERLEGNATTDFGAPNISPKRDSQPVESDEFLKLQAIIMACWQALDTAVIAASDRELRKGPRGGGRDLLGILKHVVESDASDLARLAWNYSLHNADDPYAELGRIRQSTLNALARAALDGIPEQNERRGVIWTPRQYVRNLAWHTLDHTWEIEDRII